MAVLSQRKLSAWVCGTCLATIWAGAGKDGLEVEKLIPGLLFRAAMAISMIRKEHPMPLHTTLVVSGVLLSILIVLTVLSGPSWKILAVSVITGVFLSAQWFYIKSFGDPAKDPRPIDPSQSSGKRL